MEAEWEGLREGCIIELVLGGPFFQQTHGAMDTWRRDSLNTAQTPSLLSYMETDPPPLAGACVPANTS